MRRGLELAVRADVIFAGATARFCHPEQAVIGNVTLLGGVYRMAERVGRARAIEWALTSEQVPAQVLEQYGGVNKVVEEATAFAKLAKGPTRAHAAHKALLRVWAVDGIAAADEVLYDTAAPLLETEDSKGALAAAVKAFNKAGLL